VRLIRESAGCRSNMIHCSGWRRELAKIVAEELR